MTIEQTRAQVIAIIWQAVAQSGVDLSAIPQEQQAKLVSKIAENLLESVDKMLEEALPAAAPAPAEPEQEGAEQTLWQGRPFLSLTEKYLLTSERLKVIKGMVSRDVENFELIRFQDIDLKQNVSERVLGIGDITIRGADPSDPKLVIRNIKNPEEVYETLRRAWLEARKRYGLQFREYM